jgi:hypothetical protein
MKVNPSTSDDFDYAGLDVNRFLTTHQAPDYLISTPPNPTTGAGNKYVAQRRKIKANLINDLLRATVVDIEHFSLDHYSIIGG